MPTMGSSPSSSGESWLGSPRTARRLVAVFTSHAQPLPNCPTAAVFIAALSAVSDSKSRAIISASRPVGAAALASPGASRFQKSA